MHRQALGLMEIVLGREHPNKVTSVYCLTYLLHLQQRLSEAGLLYQRALVTHVRPRSLVESPLWTLSLSIGRQPSHRRQHLGLCRKPQSSIKLAEPSSSSSTVILTFEMPPKVNKK